MDKEAVNHPKHYNSHPSGVECITVVEHMNFCLGNAMKYIWRAGEKGDAKEDIRKAIWYLNRELERIEPEKTEEIEADTTGRQLNKISWPHINTHNTKTLKYDKQFMMDEEIRGWLDKAVELANFMRLKKLSSLGPININ